MDSKDEKRALPAHSTADYVGQIRSAIRLGVPQDQWLKIIEDQGGTPDLIDELRLIWDISAGPPSG